MNNIYVTSAACAVLAMLITQVVIVKKQMAKYKLANLKWEWSVYFKKDFLLQIIGTLLTILLGTLMLSVFLQQYPKTISLPFFIASFFCLLGYGGTDIATKFFSSVNTRYNAAVDFKTTGYDAATGNLDKPTPAAKPQS
jgi:hypothetical protein